jgi:hypothetical protein
LISAQVGIITALTIIAGVAILTIYIFLLKMNGWIGNNSEDSKPIPEAEKPKQKPIEKKNSTVTNENKIAATRPQFSSSNQVDNKTPQVAAVKRKIELNQKSTPRTTETPRTTISKSNNENKNNTTLAPAKKLQENVTPQTADTKPVIRQEFASTPDEKPEGCKNYLGYLGTIPVGKSFPDECFTCNKLIECPTKATPKSKESFNSQAANNELIKKQSTSEKETPPGCIHYLGYLARNPQNMYLSDQCFTCSRLIECVTSKA